MSEMGKTKIVEIVSKRLGLPSRFSEEELIDAIQVKYKRNIIVLEMDLPKGIFGAWISNRNTPEEYIISSKSLLQDHQLLVRLHEISHFLLGHPPYYIDNLDRLVADVVEEEVLHRSFVGEKYSYETEAETLALHLHSIIKSNGMSRLMSSIGVIE